MPWDNNNSGGGRGNGGGPWGQSPGGGGGGPRKPGGTPPNLEDIFKQSRDQLQGGLPGGGKWLVVGVLAAVLVLWGMNSVYQVDPQEVGVETLFGKAKDEVSSPGLHFHMWPIEKVEKVTITENQTRIPASSGGRTQTNEGLMLTGDQNIVNVAFSVLWRVTAPAEYLFNLRSPNDMVRSAAESAMREVVGRRPAQDIFRDDRAGIALEVEKITQDILTSYAAGITVSNISIEQVAPPNEVADAFDEVQRAEQDEDRFQEEARRYANTKLGEARGQSAQLREEAAAYKDRVVKEAEGEAARFTSVYEEYAKAPDVTRKRIFLETMEDVLGGSQKVIIEGGPEGSGVLPYLPLPELRSNNQGGQQ